MPEKLFTLKTTVGLFEIRMAQNGACRIYKDGQHIHDEGHPELAANHVFLEYAGMTAEGSPERPEIPEGLDGWIES